MTASTRKSSYLPLLTRWIIWSKHSNTDERIMWTAKGDRDQKQNSFCPSPWKNLGQPMNFSADSCCLLLLYIKSSDWTFLTLLSHSLSLSPSLSLSIYIYIYRLMNLGIYNIIENLHYGRDLPRSTRLRRELRRFLLISICHDLSLYMRNGDQRACAFVCFIWKLIQFCFFIK